MNKNEKKEEIQLSVVNSKFIQGKIKHRYFSSYIYLIIDTSSNQKIIKGKLKALDGSFDKPAEKFEIKFKPELKKGNYQLKIYSNNSDYIELKNEIHKSIIHIKDE